MRILYVNMDVNNTRDRVTIRGLRECGVEVLIVTDNARGIKKFFNIKKMHRELRNAYDMAIVGYTGGILVPLMRLISRKRVVYNALSSLYEGMVISRGGGFSLKAPWYYLIDFFAFHLAHLALVESATQKKFICNKFFLRSNKISVHYTGTDDKEFYFDPSVKKLPSFTAVFRGKFMPEAGLPTIIKAAQLVENENISIRIIGHGFLEQEIRNLIRRENPKNLELITSFLPIKYLREKMLECHLSLGQLSNHPRLLRTIPHKAFESLAMRLPYLSARKGAIMELVREGETALYVNPDDADDLAEKIIFAKKHLEILEKIAARGYNLFLEKLTPKKLAERLLQNLRT